jgi:hypothetical protein
MPDTTNQPTAQTLALSAGEVELLRAALKLLIATLGREEADELAEAQALLARLPSVGA